jgi:hypothetical protein
VTSGDQEVTVVPWTLEQRRERRKPRGASARRVPALIEAYTRGIEPLDEAVLATARSAALLTVRMDAYEAKIARGVDVDDHVLQRVSNSLSRALLALQRLKPKPSSGGPAADLGDHLAAIAQRRAERERLEAEAEEASPE